MGLTTMRTLLTCSLNWELRRKHGSYSTPSKAYANSVPDQPSLYPGEQHTLAFYIKCVPPVGHIAVLTPETIWYVNSSPSWSMGLSIQGAAMDVGPFET